MSSLTHGRLPPNRDFARLSSERGLIFERVERFDDSPRVGPVRPMLTGLARR